MNWLILRTDARKEQYVAAQVRNLGFNAWVPVQLVYARREIGRRITAKGRHEMREIPILPRRVFAAVPRWVVLQGELEHIRHLIAVECDADSRHPSVPDAEIAAFRAAIDAENTAALALAQKASRKQKARWRSLKDALLDMIESAKQQMEQAA